MNWIPYRYVGFFWAQKEKGIEYIYIYWNIYFVLGPFFGAEEKRIERRSIDWIELLHILRCIQCLKCEGKAIFDSERKLIVRGLSRWKSFEVLNHLLILRLHVNHTRTSIGGRFKELISFQIRFFLDFRFNRNNNERRFAWLNEILIQIDHPEFPIDLVPRKSVLDWNCDWGALS